MRGLQHVQGVDREEGEKQTEVMIKRTGEE